MGEKAPTKLKSFSFTLKVMQGNKCTAEDAEIMVPMLQCAGLAMDHEEVVTYIR